MAQSTEVGRQSGISACYLLHITYCNNMRQWDNAEAAYIMKREKILFAKFLSEESLWLHFKSCTSLVLPTPTSFPATPQSLASVHIDTDTWEKLNFQI
jgi:hypothetical protein